MAFHPDAPAVALEPKGNRQVCRRHIPGRFLRPFHETHGLGVEVVAKTRVAQFAWIVEPIKIKVIQV